MSPNRFSVTMTSKSAGVHELVLQADPGILLLDDARRHLAPQPGSLEHVRLVDRRQPAAARLRKPRCDADDARDLVLAVGAVVLGPGRLAALLAEVDSARQLADDQHVHPAQHRRLQRRRRNDARVRRGRPQVREHAERAPQLEQSLLRPDRR